MGRTGGRAPGGRQEGGPPPWHHNTESSLGLDSFRQTYMEAMFHDVAQYLEKTPNSACTFQNQLLNVKQTLNFKIHGLTMLMILTVSNAFS